MGCIYTDVFWRLNRVLLKYVQLVKSKELPILVRSLTDLLIVFVKKLNMDRLELLLHLLVKCLIVSGHF